LFGIAGQNHFGRTRRLFLGQVIISGECVGSFFADIQIGHMQGFGHFWIVNECEGSGVVGIDQLRVECW
jgi:hypothetical protein